MSKTRFTHEMIQTYMAQLYQPYASDIKRSLFFYENERYGELYYYALVKLLDELDLKPTDHFLDIGSGLGKVVFQLFLSTPVAAVTGIEINAQRYDISQRIHAMIQTQLPQLFGQHKTLNLRVGDFLAHDFADVSVVYVCSTIFSFDLLDAMGQKINQMPQVRIIASFRKLPLLSHFKMVKTMALHCSWDRVVCYIYARTA